MEQLYLAEFLSVREAAHCFLNKSFTKEKDKMRIQILYCHTFMYRANDVIELAHAVLLIKTTIY